MENQRTDDDFWLMQYQKLIDQRGVIQNANASIDPILGYNFLLNGVIHVVPFLLKIWNKKDFQLDKVCDDDLNVAGIKNPKDRAGVLKAIKSFLLLSVNSNNIKNDDDAEKQPCCSKDVDFSPEKQVPAPTAPQESTTKSPTQSASSSSRENVTNAVECVVCMDDQTRVIFLPCGNLLNTFLFPNILLNEINLLTFTGHLCCCVNCSKDLNDCPMCRGKIERKIKIIQP